MGDKDYLSFEENLDEEDYGLIICGKTGLLKGLWMPKEINESDVSEKIINICVDVFGVDPEEFAEDDTMGEPPTRSIH